MVFSSLYFIFAFLPIVTIVYYILKLFFNKNIWLRNAFLIIASLFFYAWGEPIYLLLMVFSILTNYFVALKIENSKNKKFLIIVLIVLNLSLLFIFKYFTFFLSNCNLFFNLNLKIPNIVLPIGISFYTFQIISYDIDVYMKRVKAQKNLVNLSLYICFFPQLIAGPIVRYENIQKDIQKRSESLEGIVSGIKNFIIGLSLKVILANNLGFFVDLVLNNEINVFSSIPSLILWAVALSYPLQIYFDFYGYSLMAIGLGKVFGFNFPINFDRPYFAVSITDFWRKWHITLSQWFKDYVYVPLGGNRCSPLRHIFNLLVTWMLTGLWHGANWNFLIWGMYYGILILIEKYLFSKLNFRNSFQRIVYRIFTLFFIMFGWLIFRIENLTLFNVFVKGLFSNMKLNKDLFLYMQEHADTCSKMLIIFPSVICLFPVYSRIFNKKSSLFIYIIELIFIFIIFVISISMLVASTYNPFIYFRF